jgi:phosphoglycolate phosphatase
LTAVTSSRGLAAYSGYLFDLDGTLVDTASDINAALNAALEDAGFVTVDEALTRHWVSHGARILIEQALTSQRAPLEALDALLGAFLDHYARNLAVLSRPYEGVVETLAALAARGSRLAVVTNKRTKLTLPLLDALDLARFFDCVVCSDTAPRPKPAPDPALHAGRVLGLGMQEVLFVGDSTTDVECARAAGCAVVCVAGGYNQGMPPETLGADAIIGSFLELLPRGGTPGAA